MCPGEHGARFFFHAGEACRAPRVHDLRGTVFLNLEHLAKSRMSAWFWRGVKWR